MIGVALMALAMTQARPEAPGVMPRWPVVLDHAEVERWADSVIQPALAISGIPGALLVVVQRNGTVLTKAYGLADRRTGRRAHGDSTLFEYASIGKSMTALIASQLIDEGVLDLDTDVNTYLTSARVSGPTVTLRMLLGHRGGFDDDITGLFVPFDGSITMSAGELNRRLRPLVTPGIATAYDNQGYGLIGLVLRDVTGKSIPELYRTRLFEPAGMTGAVQGRPADGADRLARCYTVRGPGAVEECELWLYREGLMGAGGVAATGADMARYLRMLLGGGTIDGRTVVSPRAFRNVTDFDHYRFHPGMPGAGFAFVQFEEFRGLEYAHSGSIPGFSSMMKVFPDADVAVLATFLGGQPGSFDLTLTNMLQALNQISVHPDAKPGFAVMRELTDRFADRFIPAGRPRSSEGASAAAPGPDRIEDFLGSYVIASNHSRSLIARIGGWAGLIRLERVGADSVRLGGVPALGVYHRAGPLLYENDRGDRLALAADPADRYLAVGLSGGVFRRTDWLESPAWSIPLFGLALLVVLTALGRVRRRADDPLRQVARRSLAGAVLVLAGILAEWQWGVPLTIVRGAILGPLMWRAALHAGAIVLALEAARYLRAEPPAAGLLARIHGGLIAVAAGAIVVSTAAWRVLGAFPPYFSW